MSVPPQPPDRHGPNRLTNYLETHAYIMRQHVGDSSFVSVDTTDHDWQSDSLIVLAGSIFCLGGIVITVEKHLEVCGTASDGDPLVRTVRYSYNVHLQETRKNLFRYDNAHVHEGHFGADHKHLYDWRTGDDLPESPVYIGPDWPLLNEVIEEARNWYGEHCAELQSAVEYAD